MRKKNRDIHRAFFALLAGILAAVLLIGCGNSTADQDNSASVSTDTAGSAAESTEEEAPAESETPKAEGSTQAEGSAEESETATEEGDTVEDATEESAGKGTLVVFFSRTGEQYVVGNIDKGNTAIVAEMIAEETGAELFEVLPEEDDYPFTYDELLDVAKQEQNENARPLYAGNLPDLSKYDTIFIGSPVWWGDWPMIMYTVFENNDFTGKTLIPFSTHEGSGLSGFDKKLASACPDSTVLEGLAVRGSDAQNNQDSVRSTVNDWLSGLTGD